MHEVGGGWKKFTANRDGMTCFPELCMTCILLARIFLNHYVASYFILLLLSFIQFGRLK